MNGVPNNKALHLLMESFEAFTAVMFEAEVFWVVTPCSVVVEHAPL
jgi:hypothetical protein